jgi:hypothetical protein
VKIFKTEYAVFVSYKIESKSKKSSKLGHGSKSKKCLIYNGMRHFESPNSNLLNRIISFLLFSIFILINLFLKIPMIFPMNKKK